MNIIPNCDVIPSISASFSSDETKYEEANNEEHKRSSSTLCNFNHAPDSNGESAGIIEQIYRSPISLVETVTSKKFNRQYEHSWNYASHPTIIIRHPSKEWTIAILLKLLLVAWDMWMYRIGFKSKNYINRLTDCLLLISVQHIDWIHIILIYLCLIINHQLN